jgi:hypothetical protein
MRASTSISFPPSRRRARSSSFKYASPALTDEIEIKVPSLSFLRNLQGLFQNVATDPIVNGRHVAFSHLVVRHACPRAWRQLTSLLYVAAGKVPQAK